MSQTFELCRFHDSTCPGEGPDRFAPYTDLLTHFIRDVRKDFNAPDMPFVIGVMGNGNKESRPAQAAPASLPEFKGNVVAVHTEKCLDEKLNELVDRSWRWQRPAWDPEKKYTDLREKLMPLQKELDYLKRNRSSQGYHYNGSPKFFARAGEAFANALLELGD